MEENQNVTSPKERNPTKLAKSDFGDISIHGANNPWSPSDIDKLDVLNSNKFPNVVKECRFYFRHDPIASTVINKMVEIGITDIVFDKGKLSANEYKIFTGIKKELKEFAETCAIEYLISGLVVPEISYSAVSTDKIKEMGVKKVSSLTLPTDMWIRDSSTIIINSTMISGDVSYYVRPPDKLLYFIQNKGLYPDGTKDVTLYNKLVSRYPTFVALVQKGETKIPLENDLIVRRRPISDSPYPTPYLYSALEALKHKRNIRRMDYSLAARAIAAIQQFKVGSDEFPVTEEDQSVFTNLKDQMAYRGSSGRDIERVFQLFTNHTVNIQWVLPPLDALLNSEKYLEVNDEIFMALGFPRILTTGEALRSGASDPEFASLSPVKTMNTMQDKILGILRGIVREICKKNGIADIPVVRFQPISLHSFKNFVEGLQSLYDTGNISRTTYAGAFGYNFEEEAKTKATENDLMEELQIGQFAPQPFSPTPTTPGANNNKQVMPNNQMNNNKQMPMNTPSKPKSGEDKQQ